MMLLYAVTPTGPEARSAATEARLHAHAFGDLTVLAAACDQHPGRGTRELLAFARVLQGVWSRTVLLPVRFCTTVDRPDRLARLVDRHRVEWRAHLGSVRGHRECVVQLGAPGGPDPCQLRDVMAPYAVDTAELPRVWPDRPRISFLVPDHMVEAARSAVTDWSGGRVSFTGPWPPFTFSREVRP